MKKIVKILGSLEVVTFPEQALPYLMGSCTVDTARLQIFLGSEYRNVIKYSVKEAFADCFRDCVTAAQADEASQAN